MRQQAYESMLRQRELALEEREKDLVIRELTVALQQLNPMPIQPTQPLPPPEPKKRRRVGSRLLTNFLRSSSSHSSHHNNPKDSPPVLQPTSYQTQASYPSLTSARSIDISTPSDFHHCLSVQQEIHHPQSGSASMQYLSNSLRPSLCSTPTDESAFVAFDSSSLMSASQLQNTSSNHLIFPSTANGSPNLRLRVMVPSSPSTSLKSEMLSTQQKKSLTHQKTLSPNRLSGKSPFRLSCKSSSVDIHEAKSQQQQLVNAKANQLQQQQLQVQQQQQQVDQQANNKNSTSSASNNVWYHQNDVNHSQRSCSFDVNSISSLNAYQTNDQVLPATGPSTTNTNANTNSSSSNPPTKKIKRLIYEIGNLLSYVGISKDNSSSSNNSQMRASSHQPISQTTPSVSRTASPQPLNAPNTTPSSIKIISPDEQDMVPQSQPQQPLNCVNTRRSQFKKQTPSTIISSCSNHDMSELLDTNLDRNNPDFKQYRSKHRN